MKSNRYLPEMGVSHFDLVDEPGSPTPRHEHATNISGLWISTNLEVPGLIPRCEVLDIRIMNSHGTATVGTILRGLEKAKEERADLMNCSWGSRVPCEPINLALQAIVQSGTLVVCSAGNSGPASGEPGTATVGWPAKNSFVLAVGSLDGNRCLSPFSSTGDRGEPNKPDLVEIGEGILTTGTALGSSYGEGLVKTLVAGTSFSAPRVVAVAAMLMECARARSAGMAPAKIGHWVCRACRVPGESVAGVGLS